MLKKILNIVLLTPALLAGVSFSPAQAQEQLKPNILNLTSDKTAQKAVNGEIKEDTTDRSDRSIPGGIHKHSLGIGIGQTFLRTDFSEHGTDKITPDIYYNYSASYSFDFVSNFHWSKHKYRGRDVTIKGLALSVKGKGFQYDAFSPFVLGGLGFYVPQATREISGTMTETKSQMVFGINLGVGAELKLNNEVTVGVIAHYHDPFDVKQDVGAKLEGSYMKLLILGFYTFN